MKLWWLFLIIVLGSCCEDCFNDPNLQIPPVLQGTVDAVGNPIILVPNKGVDTWVDGRFFQGGVTYFLVPNLQYPNVYFSVERTIESRRTLFIWNRLNTPQFFFDQNEENRFLTEGEVITVYVGVINNKLTFNTNCINVDVQEIESVLDYRFVAQEGQKTGERTITKKETQVSAGTGRIFTYELVFEGPGDYSLDISIDGGNLVEIDTTDNNYTEARLDFLAQGG